MRIRRTLAAVVALATGDGWEDQALFDYSGRALPGLRVFADVVARDKGGKR
ncbi:hypothetical protein EDC02_0507 [Micromonospora sp. Llam0]|uniref:hypothetical protein n=1 Tax=Micromonospora sp. Llam0 TaxID=2485143 RepID=UPI000FC141B3|nr:hypothetical protein [Micromonospora sp. Llam0]ROO58740.1 hypothetical protein EDC02_0507 [Micromonospora sp. Llam0]